MRRGGADRPWAALVVACLAVVVLGVVPAAAAAPAGFNPDESRGDGVSVSVTITGSDAFVHAGTVSVWRSGSAVVRADLADATRGYHYYELCLSRTGGGSTRTVDCSTVVTRNGTGSAAIRYDPWQNVLTGFHRLNVTVTDSTTGDTVARRSVTVRLLDREGDVDDDRVANARERELGLNMTNPDTDGDGLTDGNGLSIYPTDPAVADTDGDGLTDAHELHGATNATVADTDGDGLDDGREVAIGTDPLDPDTDGDGLADGREVALRTDPLVRDTDGDGLSDATEVAIGTDPTDGATVPLLAVASLAAAALAVVSWRQYGPDDVAVLPSPRRQLEPPETDLVEAADGGRAAEPDAPDAPASTDDDPEPAVDPELLPPSDRVLRLLEGADGRMRQSQIVEATEWSKAKVSRTLSDMEDDGAITRFRLGRENIVTLADEE
ncbi:MAG: helix-turn-helix domain-containing protein [Haloarculaceae archaeon]